MRAKHTVSGGKPHNAIKDRSKRRLKLRALKNISGTVSATCGPKTELTTKTEGYAMNRDTDMINNPARWPHGLLLPLRHKHRRLFENDDALGYIIASDPLTVHLGCMFFPSVS